MFEEFGINAGYVEDLHLLWQQSPEAVPSTWRQFFQGREAQNGFAPSAIGTNGSNDARKLAHLSEIGADAALGARVSQLVNEYRVRGHLYANIDPLGVNIPLSAPELELPSVGLDDNLLDSDVPSAGVSGLPARVKLRTLLSHLRETYCGSIGVEYLQIEEPAEREWLQAKMEETKNHCALESSEIHRVAARLTDAEALEQFLHKNFLGAKRFSCEGAESMIAMLDLLIESAGALGVEEIVMGMAHRGRLNVLVNIMGKNPRELFAAFDDKHPELFIGRGDVKYHLGYSTDWQTRSGANVHLSLAFNPSHLEFVNPVVEGRVRAKQMRSGRDVMPLLIHGDAAFIGQGVVPETLNLANLEGYRTEGTIHLVVNNQVGFTTRPEDSRSTRYCTDIIRMLRVPVFHVNGEDPEAVIQVTRLAVEYRQRFHKDVVIDMYCYRKYGHNEGDEPRFTQPLMYKLIDRKASVRQVFVDRLIQRGQMTKADGDEMLQNSKAKLEQALVDARKGDFLKMPNAGGGVWATYKGGEDRSTPEAATAVSKERLFALADKLAETPTSFHPNAKAFGVHKQRRDKIHAGQPFDWGCAEHMAYATLVTEGYPVRLSGQDSRRGTFTHRQAVLYDTETDERYCPLANLDPKQARFEVWDSPLSETGVLGFEYGFSLDSPETLVLWEAQFGDFVNGGQVIIDQFIVSAEDKWSRLSGIVLLLPHGYEGQGPEHSSARIERFLQLASEDNIQICNVTTPAQFFHLLRRQVIRPLRKPLVVFTPKSLLRSPDAVSTVDDLATGTFQRVIPEATVDAAKASRVLLCSGKVYYDLLAARKAQGREDVAIVRLEQLYPVHESLKDALKNYADGTPLIWVQEEPRNCGAWYFLNATLRDRIGTRMPLACVAREPSASPATGSKASHELEQKRLIDSAFAK